MKRLNAWTYGIFFAGCYLGAGFVSGNELTQFFGNFGLNGFLGLLIILVGFTSIGAVAAHFAKVTGITEVDRLCVGERMLPMPHGDTDNPLLPTFWIAAITYISFNMGGNITVVLASTPNVRRERILPGTAFGSLLLCVVASTIMIVLSLYPASMADELPMLSAAREVHPILGYGYGLLLFLAMSGSGLSKCFGISHYFACKWKTAARHPRIFMVSLVALAYLCSLVGFGDLVGTVYPIFGYLSILLLIALLWRACVYFKKERKSL